MSGPATIFDKPSEYIGKSIPRSDAARLLRGQGRYVDDMQLPRMVHAVFLRSPYAHAKIKSINTSNAAEATGVIAVYTGNEIAQHVAPYVGVLSHLPGLRSPAQYPLAVDVARWQGEPVAVIVCTSRALGEDALELIEIDYEQLPAVTDTLQALAPNSPLIHEEYDSNLAWQRQVEVGSLEEALQQDDVVVVEKQIKFGRHTGVTLETRATVCDYIPGDEELIMYYSGQAPHMLQFILAKHLDMLEENVRVVAHDVGGSFGIKVHTYGDEIATAILAKLLKRPVKFTADRLESFVTDIHARDHVVDAKIGVKQDGTIVGMGFNDFTGIGPFSMYPRTSAIECNQILNLTGAPYQFEHYSATGKVVFQNKTLMCQYRAVGHPIAMAISDCMIEEAARKINMDPVQIRRKNLIPDDAYPTKSATGMRFDDLSHHACLDKLMTLLDYESILADQKEQRKKGIYRGIGFVSLVEVTNPSPMFYGIGGAPIASQDGATVRLDAAGALHISSSVTEQGQGTNAILQQIAADVFGVAIERVKVTTGDTATVPYGGGTWASRGAGIGGEAMLQASFALKEQVLDVAAVILQAKPETLDIDKGEIVAKETREQKISLGDLAKIVYYRGNELPDDLKPELIATRHYRVTDFPFVFTNGAMAAHVEVDIETGLVKILHFWAVEDCGRVINPQLVDGQIRGGVVQGIGGALYEECVYDADGQMQNATMADYLVPMASEMPEITVAHVETPTKTSVLGAKGAGEAGTGGAPAALMNAVNNALAPLECGLWQMPMTPERVLRALGKIS
ncbi:xanthine dehydrogenase family protein molybdopterin-binding subunit [Alphaproteobacteria bacterium]|jgi:aerobic carbon-monoxide dehydrogenase large subunit|nr:xanthine dehydrogenase family protein [Alphaproteobacteria bacterium]MBT5799880.1 xanthine dehydrogenase family protein [Alphaproteobacteria bacterium]MDA9816391.1 xanthine dehydrogenase family protein molybdopterin-binding subunit [Alphaproteobacteria bacterium]MDC0462164.1 xanthine dehydrogenase family protein molybdopterin-binding subunit [Alphaproteobacteria bacterium]